MLDFVQDPNAQFTTFPRGAEFCPQGPVSALVSKPPP